MREILFRGQTRKRGEKVLAGSGEKLPGIWVYGGIFPQNKGGSYSIIYTYDPIDKKIVYADTVGQYTGLTDKNGVKIFEGDIVKFKHGGEFGETGIYFRNYAVEFVNTYVTYGLRLRNRSVHFPFKQATAEMHDVLVIGNIHDNPDLLREEP